MYTLKGECFRFKLIHINYLDRCSVILIQQIFLVLIFLLLKYCSFDSILVQGNRYNVCFNLVH